MKEEIENLKKTYKKQRNKRIDGLQKENAKLKEQIEQLSNDNHVLKTSFIIQQDQIEKMKSCSNCKHRTLYINGGTVMCYKDVVRCFEKPMQKCDNWEIAE